MANSDLPTGHVAVSGSGVGTLSEVVPDQIEGPLARALWDALERSQLPCAVVGPSSQGFELLWCSSGCRALFGLGDTDQAPPNQQAQRAIDRLASRIEEQARNRREDSAIDGFNPEDSLLAADGTPIPVEFEVDPLQTGQRTYFALFDDLRPSRDAEAAVQRSEKRFEHLLESLDESVWIVKGHVVVYANPAAARLIGIDRRELVGMDVGDLCIPEDMAGLHDRLDRTARGERDQPHEYRALTRDGRRIVIELSSVTVEHDGELAVLSFGRDVSERKRAEVGLLQADRLAALGLLAGGMAHALNNPLTYVMLNLDHLTRFLPAIPGDAALMADVTERLTDAREGAERMAAVVKRMRTFSRADETETRSVDLRSVLESVIELVGHEVHHRGRLATRFEDVPPIQANESRVEQICLGLLIFAARMLPDDGRATREVRLSLHLDEKHQAVIEVICDGCQLSPEEIDRLFDPFAAHDEARSAGFGLSVCKSLVDQLGGHISAESLPGTGLALRAALPCIRSQPVVESVPPSNHVSSSPPSATGRARVLVVDDDPGVGRALRLMLEDEHDVVCFEKPREALRALLQDAGYDLVFCDVMMPELSGMDIYQVLRFNRPGYESRIVFMTGGAFTAPAKRFLSHVPNQRLEKPFNLKMLRRLVRSSVSTR